VFRITRAPVSDAAVEVSYALTAFSSAGAASRACETTIPAQAVSVDIPNELTPAVKANGPEIITLKLLDSGNYQIGRPSVTLFLAGSARECSEAALLAAYQEGGSAEAFSTLVARNRPTVLRTCYRVVGNWHDAEDVAQLVFFALAQRQVLLQTTLARWLCAVARNASIAFLRSRNRRSRHECRAAKPIRVAPEESSIDLREYLNAALNQIAAPLRDAVQLRYLGGWSQLEAARMLGCPRGTLAQRAALGVGRLRGILGAGGARADNE
jgi:RNA polymerase sigma-70 factor (ECF subfamily)